MIDELACDKWMEEHKYLMDGHLAVFGVKGVQVLIMGKASGKRTEYKYSFSFDLNDDGIQVVMPLLQREVEFIVHRTPLSPKEWSVFLLDPQAALPECD